MKKLKKKNPLNALGPGFVTGAADDDPSGIATYSQAGAQFGTGLLWLSIVTFPLMSVVQEMCARIGLATGRGLAANIKRHFPKSVLYFMTALLVVASVLNIGADLGAMAQSVQLIFPDINFTALVFIFGLGGLGLQIFLSYQTYAKYLKWLALVLLAYIFSALSVKGADWGMILRSAVVPQLTFSKESLLVVCAVLGTTISPYLFFWQTSQEVEELISKGQTSIIKRMRSFNLKSANQMRFDVWAGMFFSNLIMFFIIAACSLTLFQSKIVHITTASEAAAALRPFVGDGAYFVFALGIIGTGLLAVPVLAGAATYALSESIGVREGLNKNWHQATAFYTILALSVVIGMSLNFVGLDTIKALFYSAVLNGLIAPFILAAIVILAQNRAVMKGAVNNTFTTVAGWGVVGIMSLVAIVTVVYSLF